MGDLEEFKVIEVTPVSFESSSDVSYLSPSTEEGFELAESSDSRIF